MKLQYPLNFYIYDFIRKGQREIPRDSHFNVMTKNIPRKININSQESPNSNVEMVENSALVDNPSKTNPDTLRGKVKIPIIKINNTRYLDFTEVRK